MRAGREDIKAVSSNGLILQQQSPPVFEPVCETTCTLSKMAQPPYFLRVTVFNVLTACTRSFQQIARHFVVLFLILCSCLCGSLKELKHLFAPRIFWGRYRGITQLQRIEGSEAGRAGGRAHGTLDYKRKSHPKLSVLKIVHERVQLCSG